MTKLTVAIVAAAVGSTEAWGSWWRRPTRNPTAPRGFAGNSKTLKEFGWSAHKHGKIGECKGDCDADYQCATGLKCFHRSSPGTVTGCKGRSVSVYDYCYKPTTRAPTRKPTRMPTRKPTQKPTVAANTYATPYGSCTDIGPAATAPKFRFMYSCMTMKTSKCSAYDKNGAVAKRDCCKCGGGEKNKAHKDTKTLTTHGYSAHNLAGVKKHGFGMCQGDCDSDAQCRGSMVCFHSHKAGNTVTGCEGKTLDIHDYCYEPNTLSSPARCQEWSCADWCKYFDQATEDAGVYAKNGCADDGADTCKCRN